MTSVPLLVIGLDGVCESVLQPMFEDDVVPRLEEVHEDSAVGPLESQLPPWTPSAWPSMYTGVNPGKHGVYGFLHFDGYEWDVVNRSHVKEFAIWELLSLHGLTSVVLNVPITYPPREFDGVLVPGYAAPEAPECHPPEIWDELNRELGDYSVYGRTLNSGLSDEAMATDLARLARMRGDAFCYLLHECDPDFAFVQFQATDTVFHQAPDNDAVIRRVYSAVDDAVGSILDVCDPDATLVVSDHGLGQMAGREFRVNDYLREHEMVATTAEGEGMPSWKSIARQENGTGGSGLDLVRVASKTLELGAHVGITSQRIGTVLQYLGLEDWVLETIPMDVIRAGTEQVDFGASTAYMRERTEMGVRINLEGREPDGVVPNEAYERVQTDLIEALEGAETPAGDPVFEAVYRREDVFDGPYLGDAPDVVAVPNRFDHFLVSTLKGQTFGEPTEPWEHKRTGILMARGEDIDSDTDVGDAHIFDIAPTILAFFGLPYSERMDGSPLPIVDSVGRTSNPSFDQSAAVTVEDDAVTNRLSDLGYLE